MAHKSVIEVLAISLLLVLSILLATVWFTAAATGNSITVTINEFGERTPELILWAIVVPIISVGLQHWHQSNTRDD